jgi:hypothetical protein
MPRMNLNLRGGEALSHDIPSEVLANAMVDLRYYPFKGSFPENVSTENAEYQLFNVDNLTSNIGTIEVNPSSTGYRDLKNSWIVVNYRIVNDTTGAAVRQDVCVANPLQSLLHFKDIKTYFDSRKVSDDHDDIYPYNAFHKVCLTERNVGCPNVYETTSSKVIYEDIYDVGQELLNTNYSLSVTEWKAERQHLLDPNNNGIDLVIRPQDGIWQQPAYIPPTTKLRIELVKNDAAKTIRYLPSTAATATYSFEYSSIQLYLRVVYPTDATRMSIDQRALVIPRMYPILRARTDYFTLPSGSSSVKLVNILAGSKPSALVVQFVTQTFFNGNQTAVHPFQGSGLPANVKSLFVRVGTKRYPKNYQYGIESASVLQNSNAYNEYVRLVKNDNDTDLQMEPFLPSDQRNYSLWFFNTRENQETIYNRADDPTGMDSITLEGSFNVSLTENLVCIVTALSNDVISINPNGQADVNH